MDVVAGALSTSAELDELVRTGGVRAVEVDLATPDGAARLVGVAGGRVDILVNNVGSAHPRLEGFLAVTDEQWTSSLTLNLMAAVRATRAALSVMLAAGQGVVVNIGSVNAGLPDPTVIDYSAAKAALTNFAKSLSKEVGPHGVRVATVHPGPVGTDLWLGSDGVAQRVSRQTGLAPEDVRAAAVKDSATHRFTRPQEVADLVVVLASARIGNLTGAGVTIDGGLVPTL